MAGMMKRALLTRALACGVCLMAFAPTAASADIFNVAFTILGVGTNNFTIDSASPPYYAPGSWTAFDTPDGYSIYFLNSSGYAGRSIYTDRGYFFAGSQLYSGTETAPIFTPGTYALGSDNGGPSGSLTMTRAAAPGGAAPEVGIGMLALLAAAAALAMTRLRMPWLRRAAT